jgi:type VI secretion system protein ImpM
MSEARESCGLFGKVPQQADFVSHHLPEGYIEYWHAWLQSALSVSREQLGDDWLDLYLTSPIWRFAVGPGICCDAGVVGVLMPSVDEVGRYFPLTIAHLGKHGLWSAYLSGHTWYSELERVALSALDEGTGYMRLIESLEALPLPCFQSLPHYRTFPSERGLDRAWVVPEIGTSASEAAMGLMHNVYLRLIGGYSLWWTQGSERVSPCLLISAGLPDAGQVVAMLDGEWSHWGWAREQIVTAAEVESVGE